MSWNQFYMVKKIDYEVTRKIEGIEIRRYPSVILATVKEMTDNDSFRKLFDYIQGNNRKSKKVAMTAPVISSEQISMTAPVFSDERSFSFVLPVDFDLETAPIPNDPEIKLEEIPPRILAVLQFSGRLNKKLLKRNNEKLISVLKKEKIPFTGATFAMRYNSPFMPGPFRKNEVAVEISDISSLDH